MYNLVSDALNGGSDAATKHVDMSMRRKMRVPSVQKDQMPVARLSVRSNDLQGRDNKGDVSVLYI